MRRALTGGVAFVVVVAALLLVLDGTLAHTSRHDATLVDTARVRHPAQARHRDPTATIPASPTLTPTADQPQGPAATALRRALSAALRSAGTGGGVTVGALVYDLTDRRELFAAAPTAARPPASVEKLWTTTAVLDRLGPGTRLTTAILGTGRRRGHTWVGNLYLRGGGDPTFGEQGFTQVFNHGEGADASVLISALQRMGIRRVSGRMYADESLFDTRRGGLMTDYKVDVPDFGGQLSALTYDHGTTLGHSTPATFAAHEVAIDMRGAGIAVKAAPVSRRTPADATLLATVSSPPMSALLRLMNVPSDDFYAELLAKQLGVLFGHGGTIASGVDVIAHTIAGGYDLRPRILDGSGLDRADATSPLQIVDLLRDLWRTQTGDELLASLPTTGVSGTVQGIGARTAAQGRCEAKTGSLDDVTNLAGYCSTRGGDEIAFGIFIDGPGNATGFAVEGRMVAAIARY